MCDYFIYYLLAGVAYAIVVEIQYRKEDALVEHDDDSEYWFLGDMFQLVLFGVINSLFWPKCIADEMIDAHLASKIKEDDDD